MGAHQLVQHWFFESLVIIQKCSEEQGPGPGSSDAKIPISRDLFKK